MTALETRGTFPAMTLRDAGGNPVASGAGDRLYVFFKTTCPTTEMSWPFLERIRAAAEGGGLRVLAVSQDETADTEEFNHRVGVGVETLYDPPPWSASNALGLKSVPAFFLVDSEGRILESAVGFQKKKMEVFAARAAQLAGRPSGALFRPGENVPGIRPG